ncbi:MAG: hypothetical protein JXD22_10945 [Sedimentisphaerales bacterium]|nr:hypothetical protein [Sedimentisphaerales bacterium]
MSIKRVSSIKLVGGILTVVVLVTLTIHFINVGENRPAPQNSFFPVYGYDRNLLHEEINYYVNIPNSIPLLDKLKMLADGISRFQFHSLEINVLRIDFPQGKKIAIINLQEPEHMNSYSWVSSCFQGSTGGSATKFILVESFLQTDYKGPWVDGVKFLYNGKKIAPDQWDHIDLSESFYCNSLKNTTAPGSWPKQQK